MAHVGSVPACRVTQRLLKKLYPLTRLSQRLTEGLLQNVGQACQSTVGVGRELALDVQSL